MSGTTHNVPIALDYTTTQSSNYNIGGHTTGGTVIHTKPLQHTYTTPEHPASAPAPAPRSSHMIPVHINTGGYTSPPAAAVGGQKSPFSPYRHQTGSQQQDYRARSEASYYEEGPRVPFYHSPRTRRELSPSASIPHLYAHSRETPAEQYLRQTGGLFGTDPNLFKTKVTPYLTSETRRMIEEEERYSGGAPHAYHHSASPPAQSASFKRISRACGTPVD
ncbi:unnamed protein product [Anisakis simplex]|uniref:ZM domain-containing protein n=1 Tax=Anisakis simplex TaxID=6269 RepID=A0A0M3J005_ANISI|nr:unnamed protein product [Anisakis simplex]